MSRSTKIQRAPRQTVKDRRSHKRQDANARGIKPMACAYRGCELSFVPKRRGQRFHSPRCRRLAWLDEHYVPREASPAVAYVEVPVPAGKFSCLESAPPPLDRIRLARSISEALGQEPHSDIIKVAQEISHLLSQGRNAEFVAIGFATAYQYFTREKKKR
jgi:hypothetical protein